jgi:hypothetical protein
MGTQDGAVKVNNSQSLYYDDEIFDILNYQIQLARQSVAKSASQY